MSSLVTYLEEACGKQQRIVNKDNPYRIIGFDGTKPRLGWVNPPSWDDIEDSLTKCMEVLGDKEKFIFIGMGGSINGVKTLSSLARKKCIWCLDSLDPSALGSVLGDIKDLKRTAVVAISKSGGTLETQTIAHTMREILLSHVGKSKINKHFLWLIDMDSSEKLDSLGWRGFKRLPIQVDGKNDIGGRFSSPHTLVFLLPLFILLDKNMKKLKEIYNLYVAYREEIVLKAFKDASLYRRKNRAYFYIDVHPKVEDSFRNWITQLFQESLGSKKKGIYVKTLVSIKAKSPLRSFSHLKFHVETRNVFVQLMAKMYYLQNFVAFYAAFKKVNFVNQPSVEAYKKKMKVLTINDLRQEMVVDIPLLLTEVRDKLRKSPTRFIEVVLYFHPEKSFLMKLNQSFKVVFPSKLLFVFIGSDWNHHSYQAAYKDKDTLFVLLTRKRYKETIENWQVNKARLKKNAALLRLIAYATHLTLKRTSLLYAIG